MFSLELADKFAKKGLLSYSVHPGSILTNLAQHMTAKDKAATGTGQITIAVVLDPLLINDFIGWFDENGNPKKNDTVVLKSIPQGASTYIVAAFDPSIAGEAYLRVTWCSDCADHSVLDQSGTYLTDCQLHMDQCRPHAKDKDAAAKLWTLSEAIVGQEFRY